MGFLEFAELIEARTEATHVPLFTREVIEDIVSKYERVLRKSIRGSEVVLTSELECNEAGARDEIILTVPHLRIHERTYPAVYRGFSELFGERPSLEHVLEEAKSAAERFYSELKSEEIGRQLIVYDIYTDSFIEYRAKMAGQVDVGTGWPTFVDLSNREVKLKSALLIVTPITVAMHSGRVPDVIREIARELATKVEKHAEVIERARRNLEAGEAEELEGLKEVPGSLIALNPYLGSYVQRLTAAREGADAHAKPFVHSLGVPEVVLMPVLFRERGLLEQFASVAFKIEKMRRRAKVGDEFEVGIMMPLSVAVSFPSL